MSVKRRSQYETRGLLPHKLNETSSDIWIEAIE